MTIREEGNTSDIRVHPVVMTAVVGLLGWLVLVALTLGLGALVTHLVVGHALGHGDLDLARWFAERRTDTWNSLSKVGSYFGETVTVFIVIAIALVVLAVKRAWAQFGLLVITMAAEGGVYVTATYVISRNRPAVPRLEHLIVSDSFPSGHAAASMALYGSLCIIVWSLTRNRLWRALFLALAIVGPLIVATSRVYRGMHNTTDVISGLMIGAGCIIVGYVAVSAGSAAAHRRRLEREQAATARPVQLVPEGIR
ncbi:MAG TPA: phosphatase PAP2 family protein [Acidimicrobiia bacterium]|jgi:undecaprenyl-diphosphatase